MDRTALMIFAESIVAGGIPTADQYRALAEISDQDVFMLFPGADLIREHWFGREIHLCNICNGKSGRCSEDCTFCAQSSHYTTGAEVYPLMDKERLKKGGIHASGTPINRYSIVTTGKRLPRKEVAAVAEALAELDTAQIGTCASLGILDSEDFRVLKSAGVTRYHHNLETARSHFDRICTTHTYEARIETIRAAKASGLSVCSGGIFGIGETDAQVLEFALTLKALEVDAVPLNFLLPVKGTPMADRRELTPLRCLKIISLFRYVLPEKDIYICGGREKNFRDLHPLIFYAGASGIMTGDYLTTSGRTLQADLELLDELGFAPRRK
ncbi:MAG: biotin synthase BioB [Chloroflexi bacterium]|nr:biotin synthase BioB [Chloroflexota bacterium]